MDIFLIKKTQIINNSFPNNRFLTPSKLKEFADDNFKFCVNGKKFFKQVENTWVKEKLLVTSNFSISHSVFERLVQQTRTNQGLFGKGLRNKTFKEPDK